MTSQSDWFRRFLLPGFAFKAVVIGGGYATGRELATFFLASGPRGGLYAALLATIVWSAVCALTFFIAWRFRAYDYRAFFRRLLGPFWAVFEIAYGLALMVTLAVFAAAAGAIGATLFGWPDLVGALLLIMCIAGFAMFGNRSVEALFKYVSIFLYLVYALFLALALSRFGPQISDGFALAEPTDGWIEGGLSYAAYNVAGAVVILPMIRHFRGGRDAVVAGLLAGPLAMVPAIAFLVAMIGFYPAITDELLPSDFLLARLDMPVFRYIFLAMIFSALVESGVGGVHAINERIEGALIARERKLSPRARLAIALGLLGFSAFVASRVGLVALVADGYRFLAYVFLAAFVGPLFTRGIWLAFRRPDESPDGLEKAGEQVA